MYGIYKPIEDEVAQKRLIEIYNGLKPSWKSEQGFLEYDSDHGFILVRSGAIGICSETDRVLVTLNLGTDAEFISNLVIALSDYKDQLMVKDVAIFVLRDQIFHGSNAILKYSQFLHKNRKLMTGEEGISYEH